MACIDSVRRKYSQTNSTPCMQHPLKPLLGSLGNTPSCQAILNGTFHAPPSTPPHTLELFNELQSENLNLLPPPSIQISSDTYTSGWKKMKEFTSAGPSGLHFGHMKTCSTDPFLSQVESCFCNIPPSVGFSPPNWQQGVTAMIQKRIGSNLVDKLRSICICEADFNFFTKVLGYKTMQHAEQHNLLAPEQYTFATK